MSKQKLPKEKKSGGGRSPPFDPQKKKRPEDLASSELQTSFENRRKIQLFLSSFRVLQSVEEASRV